MDNRWIRPLISVLCIFGEEAVNVGFGGVKSSNSTIIEGYPRHSGSVCVVKNLSDYFEKVSRNRVFPDERLASIKEQIEKIALEKGLCAWVRSPLVDYNNLLDDISGLLEEPFAFSVEVDERFSYLPKEVVLTVLCSQQKYIPLWHSNGDLSDVFIAFADGKRENMSRIRRGNQRVMEAKLSDAGFFLSEDTEYPLVEFSTKLKSILFHKELGTMA